MAIFALSFFCSSNGGGERTVRLYGDRQQWLQRSFSCSLFPMDCLCTHGRTETKQRDCFRVTTTLSTAKCFHGRSWRGLIVNHGLVSWPLRPVTCAVLPWPWQGLHMRTRPPHIDIRVPGLPYRFICASSLRGYPAACRIGRVAHVPLPSFAPSSGLNGLIPPLAL